MNWIHVRSLQADDLPAHHSVCLSRLGHRDSSSDEVALGARRRASASSARWVGMEVFCGTVQAVSGSSSAVSVGNWLPASGGGRVGNSCTSCTHNKGQGGAVHHPGLCVHRRTCIVQTLILLRIGFVLSVT